MDTKTEHMTLNKINNLEKQNAAKKEAKKKNKNKS